MMKKRPIYFILTFVLVTLFSIDVFAILIIDDNGMQVNKPVNELTPTEVSNNWNQIKDNPEALNELTPQQLSSVSNEQLKNILHQLNPSTLKE
ncbi:MAG: hypothetical protein QW331_04035, partial [Candidatus Woesearchaeota archaeon]